MMKKFLSLGAFILALGLLTFVACKKEDTQNANSSTIDESQFFKGISLVEGQLIFEHEGYIQSLTQAVLKDRDKSIAILAAQFPNFKSYHAAYLNLEKQIEQGLITPENVDNYKHLITIIEEKGEKYVEKTNDAIFLGIICNEDGYFQVENTIYQVTRDYMIEIDATSKAHKKRHKIERQIVESSAERASFENDLEYQCSGKKNLKARCFIHSTGVYSEGGTVARNSKKMVIGWASSSVSTLRLESNYTIERWSGLLQGNLCSTTNFIHDLPGVNTSEMSFCGTSCWGCCGSLVLLSGSTTKSTAGTTCGSKTITATLP